MFPHRIEITHAIGRQGQSCRLFCPVGQMYRGFENPRLFKDRPTDGNPAAAPHPSIFQRVHQRMQPCGACLDFATIYSSIVQRIIWLQAWSTKLPPQPTHPYMSADIFAANAAPSEGRSLNSRTDRNPTPYSEARFPNYRMQMQPRPKDGLSIAGGL